MEADEWEFTKLLLFWKLKRLPSGISILSSERIVTDIDALSLFTNNIKCAFPLQTNRENKNKTTTSNANIFKYQKIQ